MFSGGVIRLNDILDAVKRMKVVELCHSQSINFARLMSNWRCFVAFKCCENCGLHLGLCHSPITLAGLWVMISGGMQISPLSGVALGVVSTNFQDLHHSQILARKGFATISRRCDCLNLCLNSIVRSFFRQFPSRSSTSFPLDRANNAISSHLLEQIPDEGPFLAIV